MQTDLDTGATTHCFCWKLTRKDGIKQGFTDHDKDLTFDTVTFKAATGLTGSAIKNTTGLNVNDMEGIGVLNSDTLVESDIVNKLYDNAAVSVYRVDWLNVTKRIEVFTGFLGTVSRSNLQFKAEVRSISQALNQPYSEYFQKTCRVDLGDSRCGIDLNASATYKINGTVGVVYNRRLFTSATANIFARPAAWFTAGKITWLTGDNAGYISEIKTHSKQPADTQAWVEMWESMPVDITVGDTFQLQVGCAKTVEVCKSKFDNVINFRGFPRMPPQDVIMQTATKRDKNNGKSWYV